MTNKNSREYLLKKWQEYSFAAYDARLYLDTHPCDERAIEYYNVMKRAYKKAYNEYTANYGPLKIRDVDMNNEKWNWVKTPWPWELEGC